LGVFCGLITRSYIKNVTRPTVGAILYMRLLEILSCLHPLDSEEAVGTGQKAKKLKTMMKLKPKKTLE
jgi:hypothetical protein